MFFLILAIICSVIIGFLFKLFPRLGIDSFQAIVFNYMTCVVIGMIHTGHFPVHRANLESDWWPYGIFLGFVFISGFNAASLTVRHFSVTLSIIMQKMSIILTVPFAVLFYHESFGPFKGFGMVMAVAAIILVNWKNTGPSGREEGLAVGKRAIWIPIVTWLLACLIEIVFIRVQKEEYANPEDPNFMVVIFFVAGLLGLMFAAKEWIVGKRKFEFKNVWSGIALGIPNYGSIYFLLLALGTGLEGSLVFPLVNVGIILLTTIGAYVMFQERMNRLNWIGIVLAILSIVAISSQQ